MKTINYTLVNSLAFFALIVLALAVIIVGRPVLMPIALAILFTFILTPLVSGLEKIGIGRVASVCVLVAIGGCCLVGLLSVAFIQANELASNLPSYWQTTEKYVDEYIPENSMFSKVWSQAKDFVDSPTNADAAAGEAGSSSLLGAGTAWLTSISSMLGSAIAPLATMGAVVVLTIFMLIMREDIRNRFIGSLGESRLLNATRVMNDTSERLSKYLLGLFSVNFGFSVVLTLGLFLLGVPYSLVWGIVSFFFRFIPYLGSTLSMCLPLITSVVTQQSWFASLGVIALYGALEFTTGNFIEPNLFGNSVGMNPVALLIALMFWAWAWGTIGLAMAVPLTLIIVTLGRHLPCFESLEKLAGNSDPMPPHVVMYQRLLSNDIEESQRILALKVSETSLSHAMENTVMRTLELARVELRSNRISDNDALLLETNARALVTEYLKEQKLPLQQDSNTNTIVGPECQDFRGLAISCCNQSAFIGMVVAASTTTTIDWSFIEQSDNASVASMIRKKPDVILIAGAPPSGIAPILQLCHRLRRLGYQGNIVVGYWRRRALTKQTKKMLTTAGADFYSHRIWTISRLLTHLDALRDRVEEEPMEAKDSGALVQV